jgi:hypothetical protein
MYKTCRLCGAARDQLLTTGRPSHSPESWKDGIEGNRSNHSNEDIGTVYEVIHVAGNLCPIRHGRAHKAACREKP